MAISSSGYGTQSTPPINTSVALERLNGSLAMLGTLATFFLEDAPQLLDRLHAGVESKSYPQITSSVHSLRGLASTFEATPFMEIATEVEDLSRIGDSSRLPDVVLKLDAEFARLVSALQVVSSTPE